MPVIQAHSADPLLQPFQLRHLTLRNRILSTAHAPGFAEQGHPRERYRLHHGEGQGRGWH
jgi:2,4-dienoyl-CoA reductase-like NADH-dependent reductase (Old Yellow Enzyme family)